MLRKVLLVSALTVVAATGGSAVRAHAARKAPPIVLVYDRSLHERTTIADAAESERLLRSLGPESMLPPGPPPPPGQERVAYDVALFWGTQWEAAARSPERLRTLRADQANQHGWYYPAVGDAPALMSLGAGFRVVSDSGLAVLRRHGVATHLVLAKRP